jgi:hypothetical protein
MSLHADQTCRRPERCVLRTDGLANIASPSMFGAMVLMAQPTRRNRYWDERPYQRPGN